jgi:hypothetical protein
MKETNRYLIFLQNVNSKSKDFVLMPTEFLYPGILPAMEKYAHNKHLLNK